MVKDNDNKTWIQIAGNKPIPLAVGSKDEADAYHKAEDLVNKVWGQYNPKYKANFSSAEIMAMVAFKLAWLYLGSKETNDAVGEYLKQFEQKLDEIVVKL